MINNLSLLFFLLILCFHCTFANNDERVKKRSGEKLAAMHADYRDSLLKYYELAGTFEGKDLFGLIDKPVPKLPPFVRHSSRMWLIWFVFHFFYF